MIHYKDLFINYIGSYVPELIVTNDDLINKEGLKMKASWIERNLGITHRRWAAPDQAASDLAVKSLEGFDLGNFEGAMWVSTISPDYLTPSTASLIKKKLKLKTTLPAIDMSAACSGWIFALESGAVRLQGSSEQEALVIATEVRSRYLNPKDRRTVFLFADGAVSAHLTKVKPKTAHFKLAWTHLSTIPAEDFEILVPAGGSVKPITAEVLATGDHFIQMVDGNAIVEATQKMLIDVILNSIGDNKPTDYDLVLFHQGNKRLILSILELLGLEASRTHITFDKYGNSSSASVGVTLKDALDHHTLRQGAKVLLVTFGAGQHLGLSELVWNE
jgi:3-oxoacyl-(acyl-carrier-protein) synthase III